MLISNLIKWAMDTTNTQARKCAAALGVSPQNFGQRLKRDTFNLNDFETVLCECGLTFSIEIYKDNAEIYSYNVRMEE